MYADLFLDLKICAYIFLYAYIHDFLSSVGIVGGLHTHTHTHTRTHLYNLSTPSEKIVPRALPKV